MNGYKTIMWNAANAVVPAMMAADAAYQGGYFTVLGEPETVILPRYLHPSPKEVVGGGEIPGPGARYFYPSQLGAGVPESRFGIAAVELFLEPAEVRDQSLFVQLAVGFQHIYYVPAKRRGSITARFGFHHFYLRRIEILPPCLWRVKERMTKGRRLYIALTFLY